MKIFLPEMTMALTKPLLDLKPVKSFRFFHTLMFLLSEPVYNKSS